MLQSSSNFFQKGSVGICSFLGILTRPHYMGAQKTFFCVDFPKTISKLPKRLFQVFRLSTREIPFSNLALFEKVQILRDKIWDLVSENRNSSSERARFCFWRDFRSVALQKKFDTDCDPLSRRNLTISLQIALIWTDFSKICLNLCWKWPVSGEKPF